LNFVTDTEAEGVDDAETSGAAVDHASDVSFVVDDEDDFFVVEEARFAAAFLEERPHTSRDDRSGEHEYLQA